MGYCSTTDVYNATILTTSEVPSASVSDFILAAEKDVDQFTRTTHWKVEDSGTASAGASTTLTDSTKAWTTNLYATNGYVWIYSGTGSGQMRQIASNTSTVLTVTSAWSTNPTSASLYRIVYTATVPYVSGSFDGNGTEEFWTDEVPVQILESLSIAGTTVTPSSVYLYGKVGKMKLSTTSEASNFSIAYPQQIALAYWFGRYPLTQDVKRYCIVLASLKTLEAQMGGTFDTPSTYRLPEGEMTVGQAYINIRGTYDVLMKEKAHLEQEVLVKYTYIG